MRFPSPFLCFYLALFFYGYTQLAAVEGLSETAAFEDALKNLKSSPHGFSLVNVGLTADDLKSFDSIDIEKDHFYHQFGDLENTAEKITSFIRAIGRNDNSLAERIGTTLAEITHKIMDASGRETGWVYLRAFVPTDAYDIPRWHMDGYYFEPDAITCMYKFALTVKGHPTLLYRLPKELRLFAWQHMRDRVFMHSFCQPELVVTPEREEGVFFMGGKKDFAALHSEPPVHEKRLFFSLIPCSEQQLIELKPKVMILFPKGLKKNNLNNSAAPNPRG